MPPRLLLTHPPEIMAQYFGDEPLSALREIGDVRLNPAGRMLGEAELVSAARGRDIIVLDRATPAGAGLFEALPGLSALCRVAVDIRNIDVAAASRAGVLVTRASAGFSDAVSEWIVGAMIDLARGLSRSTIVYRGGVEPPVRIGRQIGASTVGVVGYGQIARRLCELLAPFGCAVLICDPFVEPPAGGPQKVDLATLLARSDFVIGLAAATPETENLFDGPAFALMKRGAFLINASRGDLVDEAALAEALDSGHLAGAALDVGRAPDQRPSLAIAARDMVVATPHTGGNTPESVSHQAWCVVEQVRALARGEVPDGAVNPEAWTRRGLSDA